MAKNALINNSYIRRILYSISYIYTYKLISSNQCHQYLKFLIFHFNKYLCLLQKFSKIKFFTVQLERFKII